MEETLSFHPLLIVVFLAFITPIALSRFKKIRLPIVVGEILVGIIVGRSGLGWVAHHDAVLDLLAELGFVFLMFLSGMEIDFKSIAGVSGSREKGRKQPLGPLGLGSLSFVLTLALSTLIGFALVQAELVTNPWMIALILSTTSLGVVVPVLKERGLSSGRYGQSLLVAALIADFATMLLITVVIAALSHGLTLDILLIGVLFVAFFLMYQFGMLFFNRIPGVRRLMEELSHATAQIKIRAAFTMMLIFVALAEGLGTEIILGAFLAGAIVSLLTTPEDAETMHQLESFGFGFFIPIFFIMVGVDFNLNALLDSPQALLLLPILFAAAVAVKLFPALVFRLNFSWRETFGAGSLLSARLSLIIAASAIGLRLGVITDSVNAAIILVAIITVTLAPLIFARLVPEKEPGERRPTIIVGAGVLGMQVAEQIQAHGDLVVVMDDDQERIERARRRGFEAVVACVGAYDPAAEDYFNRADRLVCLHSDVEKNYRVCEFARTTYGIEHIVTRVTVPGEMSRFEKLGVTPMNAATDQAMLLTLLTRNPSLYELLTRTDDDREVCEVIIHNKIFLDQPLRDLEFPEDLMVLAVRRDGQLIVPHGDTRLEAGDLLTLLGPYECVEKTRMMASN
ncbi:MAG: cation:proton antiporter [Anaerolineales bacterium]|nr:cation:proton antiporter [Anaerolineales bacterium]